MQLSNQDLKLQPVFDQNKAQIVAITKTSIISTDTGKCLGISCVGERAIAFSDLNWDDKHRIFYVRNEEDICPQKDILRLDTAIQKGEFLKKQKVLSKDRQKIGKLIDFIFNPLHGELVALIVKRRVWFSSYKLLIYKNNILEADNTKIIIKNSQAITSNTKKAAPNLRTALSNAKSSQGL